MRSAFGGNTRSSFRPTMLVMSSPGLVSPMGFVHTSSPSLRTVTRSASLKISSRLWET